MKAIGLQVGNYLEYKKRVIRFELGDFSEASNNSQFLELFIKPIPLTEQWLKDFGFRENNKKFFRDHPYFIGYKDWRPEGFWMLRDPEVPIRLIKYVHQLQNLYFALTEKELIKYSN